MRSLAAAIILQAVEDWRRLCKGKKQDGKVNFNELRRFFKSEWFVALASEVKLSPAEVLRRLDTERKGNK